MSYLQTKAAQGHEPSIREMEKLVAPDSLFIWEAYWELSKSANIGFDGASRIQISEVLAYCELFDIRSPSLRERLLAGVQAMDVAGNAWCREHQTMP